MTQERICVDPAVVEQQQNDQAVLDHQHRQYATLDAVCQGLVHLELAPAPDAVDIRVRRQLRVHHRHRAFVALQQVVLEEGAAGEGQHALSLSSWRRSGQRPTQSLARPVTNMSS
ncbi:hypothetical protein [Streptomyces sindenensis]|uniref:hypothetical protein n=1 Tax=Streptomyces sindenensis TaxID=67363 RepID=UPI00167342C5|nr:hypothetical protein [Streptomyces sindenensis]